MNITVEEFTSPILITIGRSATLDEILETMQENGIRHLPVKEAKKIVGIISERDLLSNLGKNWDRMMRAEDIMTTNLLSVYLNDGLGEVAFKLSSQKVGSAIVLDLEGNVYGIFTTTDALNALVEIFYEDAKGKSDLKAFAL